MALKFISCLLFNVVAFITAQEIIAGDGYCGSCNGEFSGYVQNYPQGISNFPERFYPSVESNVGVPVPSCYSTVPAISGCASSPITNAVPSTTLRASSPVVESLQFSPSLYNSGLSSYNFGPTAPQPIAVGEPYPSADCGPGVKIAPIRFLRPLVLPPVNEPIRALPAPVLPPPTVISNRCVCTKVVQKPQLYQRVIQVQKNQRFLKKTVVPRIEKVSYNARPRC